MAWIYSKLNVNTTALENTSLYVIDDGSLIFEEKKNRWKL